MYTVDLVSLVEQYGLYADDTQIYGCCPLFGVSSLLSQITTCVGAVADWMQANRLQLSCDNTDLLWLTNSHSQHRLPTSGLTIGSTSVIPATTVCDLGVTALVLSRLDYRNSVLVSLLASLKQCLQLVPKTASGITSTLQMHWLAFIGYVFKSRSSLKLPFWHIEHYTAPLHLIWCHGLLVSLMCPYGEGWHRRLVLSAVISLVYRWGDGLPGCRHLHLEWFAGGCDLCSVTACVCFHDAWRQFCSAAAIRTLCHLKFHFSSDSGPSSIFNI